MASSRSGTFVDQSPNPEESSWRREGTELLTEAINCLGPKIRRTMLLSVIEERSFEETAQTLGTSISAVKSRLFQGRQKLRGTVNRGLLWGLCTAARRKPKAADRWNESFCEVVVRVSRKSNAVVFSKFVSQ